MLLISLTKEAIKSPFPHDVVICVAIQLRAGSIPTEVGQLVSLQQLLLQNNQLTGAI